MTTVIIDERDGDKVKEEQEVKDGQIRADNWGRVVLIVTDVRYPREGHMVKTETLRAIVLKESSRGNGVPFKSIPKKYTREDIMRYYPTVLEGSIIIHGEAR